MLDLIKKNNIARSWKKIAAHAVAIANIFRYVITRDRVLVTRIMIVSATVTRLSSRHHT